MKNILFILLLFLPVLLMAQKEVPPPPPIEHENSRDSLGVFDRVEVEASFPGGDSAWRKYLENNFRVEQVSDKIWETLPAKQKRKSGVIQFTAIVQFIVCKDGTVCEVKTVNNVPEPLKKEAERLIIQSKEWIPAEQSDRKVKAYRKQLITLQIPVE